MKPTMMVLVAALAGTVACGNKKDDAQQQTAPSPTTAPAKVCDKGQVSDGHACVAVVTPQVVEAVKAQESQLEALTRRLDQAEVLAKPVEILAAVRQLSAWKTFAAKGGTAAKVDAMVVDLDRALQELRVLKEQLASSKSRVADLGSTLQGIYDGTGAARTLADARATVSAEVTAAIAPLETQVAAAIQAMEPALADLEQLREIVVGVCALAGLNGGDEVKVICATGREAFDAALAFIKEHKDQPKTLLTELTLRLETDLEALVTNETKQLLDKAQKAADQAVGAPPK
ncbi:MAG TPA: hypothetical protein VML75_14230 [Kofleriaceae bacterium]|nr:hypothetical protein [Kofleriaceae bacterium]